METSGLHYSQFSKDLLQKKAYTAVKATTVLSKTSVYTGESLIKQGYYQVKSYRPDVIDFSRVNQVNFQSQATKYMTYRLVQQQVYSAVMYPYKVKKIAQYGSRVAALSYVIAKKKYYTAAMKITRQRAMKNKEKAKDISLTYNKYALRKKKLDTKKHKDKLLKAFRRDKTTVIRQGKKAIYNTKSQIKKASYQLTRGNNLENKVGAQTQKLGYKATNKSIRMGRSSAKIGKKLIKKLWKNRKTVLYYLKHPLKLVRLMIALIINLIVFIVTKTVIIVTFLAVFSVILAVLWVVLIVTSFFNSKVKEPACLAFTTNGIQIQAEGDFVVANKQQYKDVQYTANSIIFKNRISEVKTDKLGLHFIEFSDEEWYLAEVAPAYSKKAGDMMEVELDNKEKIKIINVKNAYGDTKKNLLEHKHIFKLIGEKENLKIQKDMDEQHKWNAKVIKIYPGKGKGKCFEKKWYNADGTETSDAVKLWKKIYEDLEEHHLFHLKGQNKYQCVEFVNWRLLKKYGKGVEGKTGNGNEMYKYVNRFYPRFTETDYPVKNGVISLDFNDAVGHVAYIDSVKYLGDDTYEVVCSHGNIRVNENGVYFQAPNPLGSSIVFYENITVKGKNIIKGRWQGKKITGFASPKEGVKHEQK
ncbi:CHAP domain-containing protein [Bulleidia sp. zg-1006]|uniref:CHAP domain-containing protein n=1 Tax=Bulleidia sp. zg-1006 TaxID=2806552 RepID=UPI00193A9F73|nr:CHAP domain-containing protein [Bulleidia sp. zg-1006]QRG86052.1 CHAP domain-containing protein [Bulleidia sp. zg-1006]